MRIKKYLVIERIKVLWLIQSNPVDDFNAIAFVPQGPEQSSTYESATENDDDILKHHSVGGRR